MKRLWRFLRRQDGPTTIEYAVLLAGIVLVCITAITLVGQEELALPAGALFSGPIRALLPVLVLVALAGMAASMGQTGIRLLPKKLAPDFKRLNPLPKLKKTFASVDGPVQIVRALAKVLLVAGAAYLALDGQLGRFRQPLISQGLVL